MPRGFGTRGARLKWIRWASPLPPPLRAQPAGGAEGWAKWELPAVLVDRSWVPDSYQGGKTKDELDSLEERLQEAYKPFAEARQELFELVALRKREFLEEEEGEEEGREGEGTKARGTRKRTRRPARGGRAGDGQAKPAAEKEERAVPQKEGEGDLSALEEEKEAPRAAPRRGKKPSGAGKAGAMGVAGVRGTGKGGKKVSIKAHQHSKQAESKPEPVCDAPLTAAQLRAIKQRFGGLGSRR